MAFNSGLLSLASRPHGRGCNICRYFSPLINVDLAIFLHRWWYLRKRLSKDWSLGARGGISQTDFFRLLISTTTIVIFYTPLSIIAFIQTLLVPKHEYSWNRIHEHQWTVIMKTPELTVTATWGSWIIPITAISLFSLVGITRTSKHLFELLIEWVYDNSPSPLKQRLPWMRNISAKCKQLRLAIATDAELQQGMT